MNSIGIQQIVRNLYFNKNLDVNDISEVLLSDKNEIKEILTNIFIKEKFVVETIYNNISFRRINDKECVELRKKALPIDIDYLIISNNVDYYLNEYGIADLPAINAVLSYYFGDSSQMYDNYKSSFLYLFLFEITNKTNNAKHEYMVSVKDLQGSIHIEFYKLDQGYPKDKYFHYHEPFPDLPNNEIEKIWFAFLSLVKYTIYYFIISKSSFSSFYKEIEQTNTFYGYKNIKFYIESYGKNINMSYFNKQLFSEIIEKKRSRSDAPDINIDVKIKNILLSLVNEDIFIKEVNDIERIFRVYLRRLAYKKKITIEETEEETVAIYLMLYFYAIENISHEEYYEAILCDYERIIGLGDLKDFKKEISGIFSDSDENYEELKPLIKKLTNYTC